MNQKDGCETDQQYFHKIFALVVHSLLKQNNIPVQ